MRKSILSFLLLSIAFMCSAIEFDQISYMGCDWRQIAIPNKGIDIPIYKSTSKASECLVYNPQDITDPSQPLIKYATWSGAQASSKVVPIYLTDPAPVFSNNDNWICVMHAQPPLNFGYVEEKYCTLTTPTPITYERYGNSRNMIWNPGHTFVIMMTYNKFNKQAEFEIAVLDDSGKLGVAAHIEGAKVTFDNNAKVGLTRNANNDFSLNLSSKEISDQQPDMQKFPGWLLNQIVKESYLGSKSVYFEYNGKIYKTTTF